MFLKFFICQAINKDCNNESFEDFERDAFVMKHFSIKFKLEKSYLESIYLEYRFGYSLQAAFLAISMPSS